MTKRGHIPIRQCIGCRTRRPACELIRLKVEGNAIVRSGKNDSSPGRGYYLCPEERCFDLAKKKGSFSRLTRSKPADTPSKESLLYGLEEKGRLNDDDDR